MRFGRRIGAIFRAFNLRCGIGGELERPSKRYGSTPVDRPAKGQSIEKHWEQMLDLWYEGMGYDRASGRPTRRSGPSASSGWCRPCGAIPGRGTA